MNSAALKFLVFSGSLLVFQGPVWPKDWDKGQIEYKSKCATCHGSDAKGHGPFASQIKSVPPDLTQLAKKNGGVFPRKAVEQTIDGRQDVEAHGPRDMPVWGYRFSSGGWGAEHAGQKSRQEALIDYLERIQEK